MMFRDALGTMHYYNGGGYFYGGAAILLVLVLWSLFWKGLALWHSAKRNEKGWFVAILIINTAGILEIIYLFAIAKKRFSTLLK